jgi:hypothetical protein
LGNEPPVFDILFWNNDTTRLPAAFHGDLIELFKNNPLIRANALEVCGTPIDLKQVTADIYSLAGHQRPHHAVAVLLQVGATVWRQGRVRAVQQRAYPEHPQPPRQPQGALPDQREHGREGIGLAGKTPPSIPTRGGCTGRAG